MHLVSAYRLKVGLHPTRYLPRYQAAPELQQHMISQQMPKSHDHDDLTRIVANRQSWRGVCCEALHESHHAQQGALLGQSRRRGETFLESAGFACEGDLLEVL